VANFYYGDCLQRRGDYAGAREYFSRAIMLGQGSAEALKAETALRSLPSVGSPSVIWQVAGAIREVWDCAECPKIIIVPAGEFSMGFDSDRTASPVHRVTLPLAFGVGINEVTRAEYGLFAAQTTRKWPDPDFSQTPNDPAVRVSWDDAKAYAAWLSQKTGKTYRLLSESEWEYAARAGTTTAYPWGETASHEYANYGKDDCCGALAQGRDQWLNTSPVGSFPANKFGVFDMHGNAWEWVEDGYKDTYDGAPNNGDAWNTTGVVSRVLRGGSFLSPSGGITSSDRAAGGQRGNDKFVGFRVARTL
jgi:formylglycine-generating enzyme required for sulfatase activity